MIIGAPCIRALDVPARDPGESDSSSSCVSNLAAYPKVMIEEERQARLTIRSRRTVGELHTIVVGPSSSLHARRVPGSGIPTRERCVGRVGELDRFAGCVLKTQIPAVSAIRTGCKGSHAAAIESLTSSSVAAKLGG